MRIRTIRCGGPGIRRRFEGNLFTLYAAFGLSVDDIVLHIFSFGSEPILGGFFLQAALHSVRAFQIRADPSWHAVTKPVPSGANSIETLLMI